MEPTTRRAVLGKAAGLAATAGLGGLASAIPAAGAEKGNARAISRGRTKIIVLGSQGGQQRTEVTGASARCGTSVLIDVDGELTILDCGCGSSHRISEAGYDLSQVRRILITHYHFDHVSDLGSFASFAWSSGRNGLDENRRLDIYGPKGTKMYEKGFEKSIGLSIADQEGPLGQVPKFNDFARWHQIEPRPTKRQVLSTETMEVTAIRVKHGGMPAVGYRIRTPDLDIAFSGDRGAHGDSFADFAKGAEVLFHEILLEAIVVPALQAQGQSKTFIEHLVDDHCNPEAVGRLATKAGVPNLVLYHLIPGNPSIIDAVWTASVLPYYQGNVVVARDLATV